MKTPYETLEVSELATDSEIKFAYLQKVKQYPPDHNHALFQEIHTAYQSIKDTKSRINFALFDYPDANFGNLLDQALTSPQNLALTADSFDKLLKTSITEQIFQLPATPTTSKP